MDFFQQPQRTNSTLRVAGRETDKFHSPWPSAETIHVSFPTWMTPTSKTSGLVLMLSWLLFFFFQIEVNRNKRILLCWGQMSPPLQYSHCRYWLGAMHLLLKPQWAGDDVNSPSSVPYGKLGKWPTPWPFWWSRSFCTLSSQCVTAPWRHHPLPAWIIHVSSQDHTLLFALPVGLCSQVSNICFWLLGLETCPGFILRSIGLRSCLSLGFPSCPSLSSFREHTLFISSTLRETSSWPIVGLVLPWGGGYRHVLLKMNVEFLLWLSG